MAPGQAEAAQPETSAERSVDITIGTTSGEMQRPAEADMTLDFDLGGATTEQPAAAGSAEAAAPESNGFDFDLGAPTSEEPAAPPAAPGAGGRETRLELSLDMDSGEAGAPADKPAPGAVDLSSISFDLDETGPSAAGGAPRPLANSQEVTTKLHLARSFEEIGDHDGARELLNEVLNEGDDAQKAQAQEMLSKLGG